MAAEHIKAQKTWSLFQINFFSLKLQRLIYATICQDLGVEIVKIDWICAFKEKTQRVMGETQRLKREREREREYFYKLFPKGV